MLEKSKERRTSGSSLKRTVDVKCRQIATFFCGTCQAKTVTVDNAECVVFRLTMPDIEPLDTPPIRLADTLKPDPVEYFVKELHAKSMKCV